MHFLKPLKMKFYQCFVLFVHLCNMMGNYLNGNYGVCIHNLTRK